MLNHDDLICKNSLNSIHSQNLIKIFTEMCKPDDLEFAHLTKIKDLMRNGCLKKINFSTIIEEGYYRGASLLHILITIVVENGLCDLDGFIRLNGINYNTRCLEGIYKNKSCFEILLENFDTYEHSAQSVKFQRTYAVLERLIEHKLINENNLNQEIIIGKLKGLTPFCFIASRMLKYPKFMRTILFSYNINQLNFNTTITSGNDAGKTPLWYIAESAFALPDVFEYTLANGPIETYDFNARSQKGKTIMHWVAEASITNKVFLRCILRKARLDSIEFNSRMGSQIQDTPLEFLVKASLRDTRVLYLLEKLIRANPRGLNFGVPNYPNTPFEGLSSFGLLCKHVLEAKNHTQIITSIVKIIHCILENIQVENIGINTKFAFFNDETPFLYLAKLASRYHIPLFFVLEHFDYAKLDFSAKEKSTNYSVLWFIVQASVNNPILLATLIKRFPIDNLNFLEKVPVRNSNTTIRDWISLQPSLKLIGLKIDFVMQCNDYRNRWIKCNLDLSNGNNFAMNLANLIMLADFLQAFYSDTYYQLAQLYAVIGDIENLKKLIEKVEEDNLYRDKMLTLLVTSTVKNLTTMNPNIPTERRERKRKLLDAFSTALSLRHDPDKLKAILAFNYIHSFKHQSQFLQEYDNPKLLENLDCNYDTSLTALRTVRAKVLLEKAYASLEQQNSELREEINNLRTNKK